MPEMPEALRAAYQRHERRWGDTLYVYAVVSRRSRGVSVGINLNPGKDCNFDCIYCQVDRQIPPRVRTVDLAHLASELDAVLGAAANGSLFEAAPFNALPPDQRAVRDIAFSGDGEPTTSRHLVDAIRIAADARRRFGLVDTRLVLITNGSRLDRPAVRDALTLLDQNNGEIWAKLDAGGAHSFQRIARSRVSFESVLASLLDAARTRPIVIQSLWMRIDGVPPADEEVRAFCNRLNTLIEAGGQVKGVQLHTIARRPAERAVEALSDEELDRVAAVVRHRVKVPVDVHYGVGHPDERRAT